MSLKGLKDKYSGSMLGIWWAIIIPVILAGSIALIFTKVFKINIDNFTLFVLSGLLPWMFFSNTIIEATTSFLSNSSLLKQGVFPRELIPLSVVITNFLNFLIGFLCLLPLFVAFNFKVLFLLHYIILILILQLIFLFGLSLFLASLNVFFKDVMHFLSVGLMVWFWVTPVFYSLEMIEFPYRSICLINPLTFYIEAYRNVIFKAQSLSLPEIGVLLIISFSFFVFGYVFFINKESEILKKV